MKLTWLSLTPLVLTGFAAALAAPSTGCTAGEDDTETAEQMDTAQDLATAKSIVALLGGPNGKCKNCHTVTATKLRAWGNAMKTVDAACFAPANLTPQQRVKCLRTDPTNPTSPFSARKLGLYATDVSHQSFKDLFEDAFSPDTWTAEYVAFAQRAAMPRGGTALTPAEFAKVKGWVLRGMPQLDQAFGLSGDAGAPEGGLDGGADAHVDAGPGACTPSTTPALAAHLTAMKTGGWGARLADQATPMFGCGNAATPLSCLGSMPDTTATYGAQGVTQKLRRIYQQPLTSHFWVRSSADGRYVGYGMNSSAKIVDLTKPANAPPIAVNADYDPVFLPSNDGFAYAGVGFGSITVCRQSLLADVAGSPNPTISMSEPKCAAISNNNVYQSIGSALEGGRYFVTWGSHENDDGGWEQITPLPAAFGPSAQTTFTPMVNDGQSYRAQTGITVTLPNEGDAMLSPSSLLVATRFGDGTSSKGYRIRFVKAQQGANGLTVQTPLAAEICMSGQKPSFSFDERFVASHQYVDPHEADGGFLNGASNIMLADLKTGQQVRLTKMKPNQFALYPHFRADGWLYFIVRDLNNGTEYVVASDAALRMSTP